MEELGKYQWFQPVLILNGANLANLGQSFFFHIGIFIATGRELNAQFINDQSIEIIINTATIKVYIVIND